VTRADAHCPGCKDDGIAAHGIGSHHCGPFRSGNDVEPLLARGFSRYSML
jgi:hypothetical protein